MKTVKIKTIDINAKEWFDRVNGNSYFSASVCLNFGTKTQVNISLPFQYGYGDHYKDMAFQELIKTGHIKDAEKMECAWRYCDRKGIILRSHKQTNCKKRELM